MNKKKDLNRVAVDRIKSAMAVNDLSQSDVASKLGVSVDTVRRRLNLETELTVNELAEWAAVLKIPVVEFIGGRRTTITITAGDVDASQKIINFDH